MSKPRLRYDRKAKLWRPRSHERVARCIICNQVEIVGNRSRRCDTCTRKHYENKRSSQYRFAQKFAHAAVGRAIRCGELPAIDPHMRCMDCGAQAAVYDHRDYSRPLDVELVCRSCNCKRGSAALTTEELAGQGGLPILHDEVNGDIEQEACDSQDDKNPCAPQAISQEILHGSPPFSPAHITGTGFPQSKHDNALDGNQCAATP